MILFIDDPFFARLESVEAISYGFVMSAHKYWSPFI